MNAEVGTHTHTVEVETGHSFETLAGRALVIIFTHATFPSYFIESIEGKLASITVFLSCQLHIIFQSPINNTLMGVNS